MLENAIAKERQTFYNKGKSEGKLETAKAMLAKGFEISIIAEMTNLSVEDIEKLMH